MDTAIGHQRPIRDSSGDTEEETPGRAAERRQIHSLGREPQDSSPKNIHQPRSGDRCPGRRTAAYAAAYNLPPLRGFFLFVVLTLGLTPQAKHLSRLRRFVQ